MDEHRNHGVNSAGLFVLRVLFVLFLAVVSATIVYSLVLNHRAWSWEPRAVKITKSELVESGPPDPTTELRIAVHDLADDKEIEHVWVRFGTFFYEADHAAYPVGKQLTAYRDWADKSQYVLDREGRSWISILLLLILSVGIAWNARSAWRLWREPTPSARPHRVGQPVEPGRS